MELSLMEPSNLGPELGALALAKSLFPHIENVDDMDEFLLFPPDLFALTSLIFSVTGAYRLIVSPPRAISHNETRREIWMPTEDEHMRDFSEFREDPKDNFKDILGLINQLFKVSDHKVSEALRKKMSAKHREKLTKLYDSIKENGYDQEHDCFKALELETAVVLNHLVKGESLYHKDAQTFQNANFADEFWEILEQWDEVPEGDQESYKKRVNRLLLEAAYPNEIEKSLTWDKRVRKAGLEWRKKLAHGFDKKEQTEFERLKKRENINNYELLIESLETFDEVLEKRDHLLKSVGELSKQRLDRLQVTIKKITALVNLSERELKKSHIRLEKLAEARVNRENEILKRREEIKQRVEDGRYVPRVLKRYWDNFTEGITSLREGNIRDLLCETGSDAERRDYWQRFISLVSMHAIADECCAGWGIRGALKFLKEGLTGRKKSDIQIYAEDLLKTFGSLSTINKDRCRVLPKRHTAEVGITLRSISCNLGFHRSSVEVKWKLDHTDKPVGGSNKELEALNVLLLPIPLEIHTTDFKRKLVPVKSHQKSQDFFEYDPSVLFDGDKFQKRVSRILENARREVGRVDLVILPEIAISENAVEKFEEALRTGDEKNRVTAYIAGVRESGERFNRNAVYFKVAEEKDNKWLFNPDESEAEKKTRSELDKIKKSGGIQSEKYREIEEKLLKIRKEYAQYKHHRWKLDRSQIVQYQLGGALSPTKSWWEAIKIGEREVNFINIGEKLTVCPLICEDLARQDPISDLIRTVGPTLVVAILMDGPQMLRRWAGKYASVLGDDPGSAVITLTSYGMVSRSLVQGTEPSRVISLWSSPEAKTEISLEEGAEAVLLSLSVDERREKSSDGREEMSGTPSLSLAGIRQIRLEDAEDAKTDLRA